MDISESDRADIRQVIERQLQAFQKDDMKGAFTFASPEIQEQFKTAENFMAMVKASYQAVYRPRSVIFSDLISVDEYPAQKVILMNTKGDLFQAIYVMEKQLDRTWRIHGCFLVPIDQQVF